MELISREQAIGEKSDEIYKTKQKGATYPHDDFFQGMAYAENVVKQLPPIQLEQTNCDFCHEDVDGYVKPIEKNGHAFVLFGMNGWKLELKAKGWHGEIKIQYCPMCGRKLKNDK